MAGKNTKVLMAGAAVVLVIVGIVLILRACDPLRSAAVRSAAEDAAARVQIDASIKAPLGHSTPESAALFKELIAPDTDDARREAIASELVNATAGNEGDSFYPDAIRAQPKSVHDEYNALVKSLVLEQANNAATEGAFLRGVGRALNGKTSGK